MSNAVRGFIESRLLAMSRGPRMFGGLEAIEFQILQLLELEATLHGEEDPRAVLEGWQRALRRRFPSAGPVYGCQLVDDADELVAMLLAYRQSRSLAPVFPLFDGPGGQRKASAR